jgi:hypothetical protein
LETFFDDFLVDLVRTVRVLSEFEGGEIFHHEREKKKVAKAEGARARQKRDDETNCKFPQSCLELITQTKG